MIKKLLGWVGGGTGQCEPFDSLFQGKEIRRPVDLAFCDALIIWGGGDICPGFYGESPIAYSGASERPSHQDSIESSAIDEAIRLDIPIIGICRGAQFVCAKAGGTLIQHVNGHGRSHTIRTEDGRTMTTSSVHHQMMYPFDVEHDLIAWAEHPRSDVYMRGPEAEGPMDGKPEPEIVYFPQIRGLAIQGHPEFMNPDSEFVKYCLELTQKYCIVETLEAA